MQKRVKKHKDTQVYDSSHYRSFNCSLAAVNQHFTISEKYSVDFVSIDEILCVETQKGNHESEIVLRHHEKCDHIVVSKPLLEIEKKLDKIFSLV